MKSIQLKDDSLYDLYEKQRERLGVKFSNKLYRIGLKEGLKKIVKMKNKKELEL
jgi:hypothetical protein